ncbi:nucleoside triphosphate pyrophosphohydrolase [Sphingomonas sp. CGMCC 1.13654]|uniref:Nucleoside triphosphate pyrophosphohydrolase n=1 Tax=Sphingomonas chungangi TaxID=2683589 RepID=A0A838L8H9_9SPHN|nr:nucleoside triphosphate pyrophosphohydrolase [Sphingomonas chungangi]MBA2935611.1 nucleoside triphosphate pyrophosphohydrolase [Sphingomonas chungangi]MVW54302.1 nucleoside triphosphate pyrophosphohydrolase [Sphingomonas chungangi]
MTHDTAPLKAPSQPPVTENRQSSGGAIERLAGIMAKLRDPETGCPWDVEQDFSTIAPYTIEEAHEVADAIARNDMADLKGELGDLQLQVVFHARMAEEAGHFALADVIESISDKMVRRHPHVFGVVERTDGTAAQIGWEQIKAEERAGKQETGALAGVALGLPALLRAEKLQKRAARVGFDWPDADGPRAKVVEELNEIASAADDAARAEEFGDLLFALVNWGRHMKIDPEAALRAANSKFERRFAAMEEEAGDTFAGLSLDDKEALWQAAKARGL